MNGISGISPIIIIIIIILDLRKTTIIQNWVKLNREICCNHKGTQYSVLST
jgi:hypothetical protein